MVWEDNGLWFTLILNSIALAVLGPLAWILYVKRDEDKTLKRVLRPNRQGRIHDEQTLPPVAKEDQAGASIFAVPTIGKMLSVDRYVIGGPAAEDGKPLLLDPRVAMFSFFLKLGVILFALGSLGTLWLVPTYATDDYLEVFAKENDPRDCHGKHNDSSACGDDTYCRYFNETDRCEPNPPMGLTDFSLQNVTPKGFRVYLTSVFGIVFALAVAFVTHRFCVAIVDYASFLLPLQARHCDGCKVVIVRGVPVPDKVKVATELDRIEDVKKQTANELQTHTNGPAANATATVGDELDIESEPESEESCERNIAPTAAPIDDTTETFDKQEGEPTPNQSTSTNRKVCFGSISFSSFTQSIRLPRTSNPHDNENVSHEPFEEVLENTITERTVSDDEYISTFEASYLDEFPQTEYILDIIPVRKQPKTFSRNVKAVKVLTHELLVAVAREREKAKEEEQKDGGDSEEEEEEDEENEDGDDDDDCGSDGGGDVPDDDNGNTVSVSQISDSANESKLSNDSSLGLSTIGRLSGIFAKFTPISALSSSINKMRYSTSSTNDSNNGSKMASTGNNEPVSDDDEDSEERKENKKNRGELTAAQFFEEELRKSVSRLNENLEAAPQEDFMGVFMVRTESIEAASNLVEHITSQHGGCTSGVTAMIAGEADGIQWENAGNSKFSGWAKFFVVVLIFIALVFFWSVPVAFFGSLDSLSSLPVIGGVFSAFTNNVPSVLRGTLQAFLPLIVLAFFNFLLPPIIRRFAIMSGGTTRNEVDSSSLVMLFVFMVMSGVVMQAVLQGGLFQLAAVIRDPTREAIFAMIVGIVSPAGGFWYAKVITAGCLGRWIFALQLNAVFSAKLTSRHALTQKEYDENFVIKQPGYGEFGFPITVWYAQTLVVMAIGIFFHVTVPLLSFFVFVYFLSSYFVFHGVIMDASRPVGFRPEERLTDFMLPVRWMGIIINLYIVAAFGTIVMAVMKESYGALGIAVISLVVGFLCHVYLHIKTELLRNPIPHLVQGSSPYFSILTADTPSQIEDPPPTNNEWLDEEEENEEQRMEFLSRFRPDHMTKAPVDADDLVTITVKEGNTEVVQWAHDKAQDEGESLKNDTKRRHKRLAKGAKFCTKIS